MNELNKKVSRWLKRESKRDMSSQRENVNKRLVNNSSFKLAYQFHMKTVQSGLNEKSV